MLKGHMLQEKQERAFFLVQVKTDPKCLLRHQNKVTRTAYSTHIIIHMRLRKTIGCAKRTHWVSVATTAT